MEKFYLEQDEDFFSVIDRIKRSRDNRIILIVPSGFSALKSIINLKILKEESISSNKEIAIITADSLIKKFSQQVNLPVLESLKDELTQVDLEERRQKEFEQKIAPPKKIISDIVVGRAKREIPIIKSKIKEEIRLPQVQRVPEPTEEELAGEEFRDLGDKEEHFEELFKKEEKSSKKEKETLYAGEKEPSSFKFFNLKRAALILIALILVGGFYYVYFILPKAEISIKTKSEPINFETGLIADKNINTVDVQNGVIPAQFFQNESEESKTFPSTGEKEVSEKARGKVVIYNQYSSGEQTLVKTTRLRSEDGKIFRLTDTVIIPGATIEEGKIVASSREVYVEADEPGEAYNIGPTKFTIPGFEGTPKYSGFYGQSKSAMTGGAKGKVKVATQSDIDGAMQIVSLELQNKAKEEFLEKIPKELKFLEQSLTLETLEASSSLKADQIGKEFTITMKVKAWGAAIKEDDILTVVKEGIKKKISQDNFLIPSSIKIDYGKVAVNEEKSKINFSCSVQAEAGFNLDEEKLKKELAGKSEIDFRQYLSSLPEVDVAKVTFWPFWVKKIPSNTNKIKIIIEGKQ